MRQGEVGVLEIIVVLGLLHLRLVQRHVVVTLPPEKPNLQVMGTQHLIINKGTHLILGGLYKAHTYKWESTFNAREIPRRYRMTQMFCFSHWYCLECSLTNYLMNTDNYQLTSDFYRLLW